MACRETPFLQFLQYYCEVLQLEGDNFIPQQNELFQTISNLFPGHFWGHLTTSQIPAVSEPWLMDLAPGKTMLAPELFMLWLSRKCSILLLSRKIIFAFSCVFVEVFWFYLCIDSLILRAVEISLLKFGTTFVDALYSPLEL